MRKTLVLASLAMALAVTNTGQAALIAFWNFNSGSSATSGSFNAGTTLAVTEGSGTLSINGVAPANQVVFAGTVTNLPAPDPDGTGRGVALALQGGVANANNGGYMEFTLDTTGWKDLIMSYAVQRTSTGFTSNEITYSVDNGPFTSAATFSSLLSSFGTTTAVPGAINTVDFSAIPAVENSSNVRVRLTVTGATAESGNNRFDNVQFNATAIPEPASVTLLVLAGLAMFGVRRRSLR